MHNVKGRCAHQELMTAAKQHDVVSNHTVGGCEIVSIYRYHRSGDFRVAFYFM